MRKKGKLIPVTAFLTLSLLIFWLPPSIQAGETAVDGIGIHEATSPTNFVDPISDMAELPCSGTRYDLATAQHYGPSMGPGSGRAIGFHANRDFTISSVGIMAALTHESFDVVIYDSPDGHGPGSVLYTTTYITGGDVYGWNDMLVNFSFAAGDYYVLNWRPTDGFNDWVVSPGLSYYQDYALPYTVGPITIVEGFEGFNAENPGNFLHPHLRLCEEAESPIPDIKANGSDGPITVSPSTPVSITVTLDPGDQLGQIKDVWLAVQTPFDPPSDWFSYDPATCSTCWKPGINCMQPSLPNVSPPREVLDMTIPPGNYTFYFAVDDNADCVPDATWLDEVDVHVQ